MIPESKCEGTLLDPQGRPYFLWDVDMTLDRFGRLLDDPDPVVSGYFHAKLMRQARPEEVFRLTTARRIRELWPHLERHLGRSRDFWNWIFERWEAVVVDLVSERADPPCTPEEARLGDATIRIASRLELLASKLCTLLNRAEIRDLMDVRVLVESGTDLASALAIAPSMDTAFSPSTLAWVLRDLDVFRLAVATGVEPDDARALFSFKDDLVTRLAEASRPE